MRYIIPVVASLLLFSCSDTATSTTTNSEINLLLKSMEKNMSDNNPKVEKRTFDGINEQSTIVSNINWQQEIALFYAVDIFKPNLKGVYSIFQDDRVKMYVKTSVSKNEIDTLVVKKSSNGKIYDVVAQGNSENLLFKTKTRYGIKMDTATEQIISYHLFTHKKFRWGKENLFRLDAIVIN